MPARVIIDGMKIENQGSKDSPTKVFTLYANGIKLQATCTNAEYKGDYKNTMHRINEEFRNSIRFIKCYGFLPKKPNMKYLDKWTQTDTGVAVRAHSMPLPEFSGFNAVTI